MKGNDFERKEERCQVEVKESSHSVKWIGQAEETNNRFRLTMEDEVFQDDEYLNDRNLGLFIILDGHAGYEVSRLAKAKIPILIGSIYYYCRNFKMAIEEAFVQFNEILRISDLKEVGSTITVCIVERYDRFCKVTTANCGDSAAIHIRSDLSCFKKISEDHNTKNPDEIQRIVQSGGELINNKVHGQVCVTRAIGDLDQIPQGMIPVPSIQEQLFEFGDQIVIASDGIWDVINEAQVVNTIRKQFERKCTEDVQSYEEGVKNQHVEDNFNIATLLVEEAKRLNSNDNICCMFLTL